MPSGFAGTYNPVGGGVTSIVYSKWIDLGVDDPHITDFKPANFLIEPENDAVFIEVQYAIENPAQFGTPKVTVVDSHEDSTNIEEVSPWMPVRYVDKTPAGGAIPIPGNTSTDRVFPVQQVTDGRKYKWVRIRITFQLDGTQTAQAPLPRVDRMSFNFDFNF